MTYKIAITGGFGTGKSAVGNVLIGMGYKVIDTDEIVHQILFADTKTIKEIAGCFGEEILNSDKSINRKNLADIVFRDQEKKKKLESIIHPVIRKIVSNLIELNSKEKFIFVLIPLLFESKLESNYDETWCVECTKKNQEERLKLKGYDVDEINRRIKSQMSLEDKMQQSDFIINNDLDNENLEKQIKVRLEAR